MAGEVGKIEMTRFITAHQLWEKYRVTSPLGDIHRPTQGWWLLVTSFDGTTLVSSTTMLMCLERLCTVVEAEDTICFHLADTCRGKLLSQQWLQLIAIIFCRQAKIRVLDQQTKTPKKPITVFEALSVEHHWTCNNMGDRLLRRTVWQHRRAIFENLAPHSIDDYSKATGK